jgi:Protein of unknown function (DUF2786)
MDKIIERVRKLLALSENNPSEAEATAAAEKAHAILAEHNLGMAEIMVEGEDEAADDPRIHERFRTNYYDVPIRDLWFAVARANGCRCVYSAPTRKRWGSFDRSEGLKFTLIGRTVNVAVASAVAEYLTQTVLRLTAAAVEENRLRGGLSSGRTVRTSFMAGCVHRLQQRLNEMRKQDTVKAQAQAAAGGNALVVYQENEAALNQAYLKSLFPHLSRNGSQSTVRSNAAYHAGRAAADKVSFAPQLKASGGRRIASCRPSQDGGRS